MPAHVVVPRGNSAEKNVAMRAQGADLIEFGSDFQEAKEHAQKLADQTAGTLFPRIIATSSKEWPPIGWSSFPQWPIWMLSMCPLGRDRDLLLQRGSQRNEFKDEDRGSRSRGAPAYALSFEAKRNIAAPVSTLLGDGMACRVPDDAALEVVLENVDHVVRVSEEEIGLAMKFYFTDTHNVVEGAGAAGLAAALKEKRMLQGRRVGLVATGGNVDHDVFARVLLD